MKQTLIYEQGSGAPTWPTYVHNQQGILNQNNVKDITFFLTLWLQEKLVCKYPHTDFYRDEQRVNSPVSGSNMWSVDASTFFYESVLILYVCNDTREITDKKDKQWTIVYMDIRAFWKSKHDFEC
jgi:hypothetical protein